MEPRPQGDVLGILSHAIKMFESALAEADSNNQPMIGYNLATALDARSSLSRFAEIHTWTEDRAEDRQRARKLYRFAGQSVVAPEEIRCQAWANLGRNLYLGSRVGEAADACVEALRINPKFGPAKAFLAKYVWRGQQTKPESVGYAIAVMHATSAVDHQADLLRLVPGDGLLSEIRDIAGEPAGPSASRQPFAEWMAIERVGFGLEEVGFEDTDTGEHLPMMASLSRTGRGTDAGLLTALSNDLKSDYLLARSLAWQAETDPRADADQYVRTSSGERFGREIALLRLSLVSAMNLVDRCSLGWAIRAGIEVKNIDARRVWSQTTNGQGPLRPEFTEWISSSPEWRQIAAAAEVRYDLDPRSGFLGYLTDARNASVHRTLSASTDRQDVRNDKGHEVIQVETLRKYTLDALRLARNTIRLAAYGHVSP